MRKLEERHENVPVIRQYVGVVLARRWLVLLVLAMTVAAVGLYTFTRAPTYRAASRILIEPKKPQSVDIRQVQEESPDREYYETQYNLLQDRKVAERVADELHMAARPEYADLADAPAVLQQRIRIEPVKHSRLVDVGFDDPDPEWSARVANAVVGVYVRENQQREHGVELQALQDLTLQAAALEPKFKACTTAMQTFRESSGLVTVDGLEKASNIVLERLLRLNSAATEAELARVAIETQRQAAVELLADGGDVASLPAMSTDEGLLHLRSELDAARQERAALAERLLPKHPRMLVNEARIGFLETRLEAENQRVLAGLKVRYQQAATQETVLFQALDLQKEEAQKLSRLATQYQSLKGEADRVGRLYDVVLERIKEIDLTSDLASRGTNIFVVHEARTPDVAIAPRTALNMIVAVLAGLMLGIGLAFFIDHLDTTLKSKADVEELLGLPILGFVPRTSRGRQTQATADLVGVREPKSAAAEAFRAIRAAVAFSHQTKDMKRLLVTSPSTGEGKTLTAVNTAAALARGGLRVLLVDSDMRCPRLHKVFNLKPRSGLASYLLAHNGDVTMDMILHRTEVPNLDLLPCDLLPQNPAELLGSERMTRLIQEVSLRYDRIIFDSPPTSLVADAGILSASIDGVLMVVRAFRTDRGLAQRSKEILEAVNGRIVGVVVNNMDASKYNSYGNYDPYYYKYYRYGRQSSAEEAVWTKDAETPATKRTVIVGKP
jgi:polysaccharide biosynthesis transport protein